MNLGQWKSLAAVQRYLSFLILPDRAAYIFCGWLRPPPALRPLHTLAHVCVSLCVLCVRVGAIPIFCLPPLVGSLYVFVYMFSRAHIHTFRDPAGPPQQLSGILRDRDNA